VVVLVETWLYSYEESMYPLQGYVGFYQSNDDYRAGGVAVYVRENLYSSLIEVNRSFVNCDAVAVNIKLNNEHSISCIACYRSPTPAVSDVDAFLAEDLPNILGHDYRGDVIFLSDSNINLLSPTPTVDIYANLFPLYGFISLNNKIPTRLTDHSATLIDHVYIKQKNCHHPFSEVLPSSGLSDHFAIRCQLYFDLPSCGAVKSKEIKFTNYKKLQNLINYHDWSEVTSSNCPNAAMEILQNHTKDLLSQSQFSIKANSDSRIRKPFVTPKTFALIKERDALHSRWLAFPRNKKVEMEYKQLRNRVRRLLRLEKDTFFKQKFSDCEGSHKKHWAVLNEFFRGEKKKGVSLNPRAIELPEQNKLNVLDYINEHFALAGRNIVLSEVESLDPLINLRPKFTDSIFNFQMPSLAEVRRHIYNLKRNKAAGGDGIPVRVIKDNVEIYSTLIHHIISLVICSGIYPDCLKISRLYPVHKCGTLSSLSNYRPISLLPIFNKIIEKILTTQLTDYFEQNHLIYENQFGFRKGRSTDMAVLNVQQLIANTMDRGKKGMAIFLDLKRAFDTVSHTRLIAKLNAYGLGEMSISLLKSYLADRRQIFTHEGLSSSETVVPVGVPQGSCLGPLLFVIFINDISSCLNRLTNTFTFADDTALFVEHDSLEDLFSYAKKEINALSEWLLENGLVLNTTKTKYMVFSNYLIRADTSHLSLSYRGAPIERVSVFRYLGILISEKLDWKPHILQVCNKIRRGLAILFRLRTCASQSLLLTIYRALIESNVAYCIGVYGGTFVSNLECIYAVQRKAARLICNKPMRTSAQPLLDILGIQTCIQLYVKDILLDKANFMSQLHTPLHHHKTRFSASSNLLSPRMKTSRGERTARGHLCSVVNKLDPQHKNIIQNKLVVSDRHYRKVVKKFVKETPHETFVELLF